MGTNRYGVWYMWFGTVEDALVHQGRGKEETKIESYSGKAMFFPTKKLNTKLIEACDGKADTVVNIKKEAVETSRGLVREYMVEVQEEGS